MTNEMLKIQLELLRCKITRNPADFPRLELLQRVVPAAALQESMDRIWRQLGH